MKCILGLSVLLLGLTYAPHAKAANNYAYVRTTQTNNGGFFSAPNVAMSSGWSTSKPCNFLVKTQWLSFNGTYSLAKDWIELGRVNGAVKNPNGTVTCGSGQTAGKVSYYDAYYTATGRYNSAGVLTYNEFPITTIGTSGTHSYKIEKTSTADWKTSIDGITTLTYTGWSASNPVIHEVGWEANNSISSWTPPNYANPLQILVNGSWVNWGSLAKVDSSNGGNNLGWVATSEDGTAWKAKYTR